MAGVKGLINKVKAMGAKALIVQRPLKDAAQIEFRRATCQACPNYAPKEDKCVKCRCIISLKSESLTNLTKNLTIEITHCPEGRWNDQEIVDLYKKDVDS